MSQRKRVLVVEDDKSSSIFLSLILKSSGYEVVGTAKTGNDALKMGLKYKPDVICMDIDLGNQSSYDGISTARAMQDQITFDLIYISGTTDEHKLDRAQQLTGYAAFINKPFKKMDIVNTMDEILRQQLKASA